MSRYAIFGISLIASFLIISFQSCGLVKDLFGTTVANPISYGSPLSTQSQTYEVDLVLSNFSNSPSPLTICIESVRAWDLNLKLMGESVFTSSTEKSLGPNTTLGTIKLPSDTVKRIEITLADICLTSTIGFTNGNGTFSTHDSVVLVFAGMKVVNGAPTTVVLDFQPYIDSLNTVTLPSEIKPNLESITGTY